MEYLDEILAFLDRILTEADCPEEAKRLIEISVEELFTNIASYAYQTEGGQVKAEGAVVDGTLKFRLWDRGIPYNPFARKDPDLTLPIEDRPVGGLGVYMVKKFMDGASYEYRDGCNITTIEKRLS